MGAPYTDIGNHICHEVSKLRNATAGEIDDTIRGLGRTGAPFKAISRGEIKELRESMWELKGFIDAVAPNETINTNEALETWNHIYGSIFE